MSNEISIQDCEEWRTHPRINKIACSSLGRIINIKSHKEYKGCASSDGYIKTTINEGGVKFCVPFHRYIAESFIGISSLTVNHINGIKTDNRACNLEYLTRAENVKHAVRTGLRKNRSTNVHNSSMDEFKVLALATFHNAGYGQEIIAELFGFTRGVVTAVTKHRTYKEFSFLINKRSRDEHAKYTSRAVKENKWIIQKEIA